MSVREQPITVGELIKKLEDFPDDWIFTINDTRLKDYLHIMDVYGFDQGEVGLILEKDF